MFSKTFFSRSLNTRKSFLIILASISTLILYLHLYANLSQAWRAVGQHSGIFGTSTGESLKNHQILKTSPEQGDVVTADEISLESDYEIAVPVASDELEENIGLKSLSLEAIEALEIKLTDGTLPFGNVQIVPLEKRPNRTSFLIPEDEFEPNRTCEIPHIYPYEEEALRLFSKDIADLKVPFCISNRSAKFVSDRDTSLIRRDPTGEFWKTSTCCYTPFSGTDSDFRNLTDCIQIVRQITRIPNRFENIQVACTDRVSKELTYRDYFHYLRLDPTREKLLDERLSAHDGYHPNVIILGVDSVSFTNFQRFMPKTRKLVLQDFHALEFSRLNKIGISTMDNVFPMLSNCGWLWEVWGQREWGRADFPGPNEDCTPIWDRFSALGYRTVLSWDEDWSLLTRRMRRGDKGTPNGTYNNLVFTQGIQRTARPAMKTFGCYEHKLGMELLSDRLLQVGHKFRGKPYFHLLWTVLETHHEAAAMVQFLDEPMREALKRMNDEGLLRDTIFMLLSDHGLVYCSYAGTFEGSIEANNPFLYLMLPESFRQKFPSAVSNLKRNSRTLVTPNDIYQTLLEILDLPTVTSNSTFDDARPNAVKRGISLFRPIPLDRTCDQAGVLNRYCLCWVWSKIEDYETNSTVRDAAKYSVSFINQRLEQYPMCLQLKLDSIRAGRQKVHTYGTTYFSVVFSTVPSGAEFQAMVLLHENAGDGSTSESTVKFELVGHIERKNAYGLQSACLGKEMLETGWIRSVCFCKDFQV